MGRLNSFFRNTTGNVALFFGIASVPLMIGTGVAVDMVRVMNTRTQLQGAADSAALAGGTSKIKSSAALQVVIEKYLRANNAMDMMDSVSEVYQNMDTNAGTFTVKISGTIPGSFMSLAGFKDIQVAAESVVSLGSQALEIALVLDNTGSMSGTKIANLKTAATNLINIIESEASDYGDIRLAVVPFAEYVNVGTGHSGEAWLNMATAAAGPWSGCVGSRNVPNNLDISSAGGTYPALTGVPCGVVVQPLTSKFDKVRSAIAAMNASGSTYIPTGLLWGWNVLDSAAPFTEGKTTSDMSQAKGQKVIVLMTDGENTISPIFPYHNGNDRALSNVNLESTCAAVKNDGIQIFTVSFMVPTTTIKDILENCASTPTRYFDADNGPELNAAFTQIARDLAAIRLTQ
jgi:Flp pilus assembly protein TadG